jgi:hypothetical protein
VPLIQPEPVQLVWRAVAAEACGTGYGTASQTAGDTHWRCRQRTGALAGGRQRWLLRRGIALHRDQTAPRFQRRSCRTRMLHTCGAQKKRGKSRTTPYPRRASASAPPKGRKEGRQRRATRDDGGDDERGRSNCAPDQQQTHGHQQARPHQQQNTQPKGQRRQELSTQ